MCKPKTSWWEKIWAEKKMDIRQLEVAVGSYQGG